jgi:hypothetical protein
MVFLMGLRMKEPHILLKMDEAVTTSAQQVALVGFS